MRKISSLGDIRNESRFLRNVKKLFISWKEDYVQHDRFFQSITTLTQFSANNVGSSDQYYNQISNIIANNKAFLREISITNNEQNSQMSDQSFIQLCNTLQNNSTITSLCIRDYSLNDANIEMLMQTIRTMSALLKLELRIASRTDGSNKKFCSSLQNHPTITSLGIRYRMLCDAKVFWALLKNSPKLSEIRISCSNSAIIALNQFIQGNDSNITSIIFEDTIDVNLTHGLRSNQKITKLELSQFRNGEEFADFLQYLREMPSLTDLTINDIVGGANEFNDYLRTAKIQRLAVKLFKKSDMNQQEVETFCGIIQNHKTITNLSLKNMMIGRNASYLGNILKNNKILTSLTLIDARIAEEVINVLSQVLESNCTNLESLTIKERTTVFESSIGRLSEALIKNETLKRFKFLYVRYKNVDPFISVVMHNKTIMEMDLNFDFVKLVDDEEIEEKFTEALRQNKNITKFRTHHDLEDYEPVLKENQKFRNQIRSDFIVLVHNLAMHNTILPIELWHIILRQTKIRAVDADLVTKALVKNKY